METNIDFTGISFFFLINEENVTLKVVEECGTNLWAVLLCMAFGGGGGGLNWVRKYGASNLTLDRQLLEYRKIPIISPGLIFVQKAFLLGLFSEGLIIGRNFAFRNGLGLTIKTA